MTKRRAAAAQAARAAGAERARVEEERRVLAEKCARLEAELASEKTATRQLVNALDLMPVPIWRRSPDLKIVDCNLAYARAVEADRATVVEGKRVLGGTLLAEQGRAPRRTRARRAHRRRARRITSSSPARGG